jgi:hypothetical protein
MNEFQNEWSIIHGDIEKYERFSLIIKLFSVLISALSMAYISNIWFTESLILVLWLQDGIWKTFQKRLETRIVFIEEHLQEKANKSSMAFQLYSQWEDKRQGVVGLIKEYIFNSAKPTVAYPYVILVSLMLVFYQ